MLFLVTQTHTPEHCPKDQGGSNTLFDSNVDGVTPKGMYGAFSEHVIYYLLEADSIDAIHRFLLPGFTHSTSRITPVSEKAIIQ
jgi:hypothetical protein